jgi:hypothetical protein
MPSRSGASTSTSGTGTVPEAPSQRSPLASAWKNPGGGESPGHSLAKMDMPSSNVRREVRQIEPPSTGVSRMRW